MKSILLIFCLVIAVLNAYKKTDIISARIETCRECSLNRLPEVKQFVLDDAPQYDKVEVKFITRALPVLVLLGEGDRELARLPLSVLTRDQCNEVMEDIGFARKNRKGDLLFKP